MFGNGTYTEGDGSRNATRVGGVSRRAVLASGVVLGGATLSGCLGGDGGNGDGGQVAIISSDAGFGDNAFNDNALEGLEEAADEFDVEITQVEETETAEFAARQEDLAEEGSYDLIVMVGYQHYEGLVEHSEAYPDQYWMLINDHVEGADNVSGWIEMNNEMSFLAGVAAATLTREEVEHGDSATDPDEAVVGFAGGEDIDLINAFEES